MQLALSTSHEVGEYLRDHAGIIIPIGSVEQHGPNGLIGTDHLTNRHQVEMVDLEPRGCWRGRTPSGRLFSA